MDYDPNLFILFTVLGVAGLFMCVYGVARLSGNVTTEEPSKYSNQQLEYMREVRQRHVNALEWIARPHR